MRDPDALDYALICSVTVLAYLQLPWRPEIRAALRRTAHATVLGLWAVDPEVYIVMAALVCATGLLVAIEVVSRQF
jgi:hypothetical protein